MKNFEFTVTLEKEIDFANGQKGNVFSGTIGAPTMQTASIILFAQIAPIPVQPTSIVMKEKTSPIILPGRN